MKISQGFQGMAEYFSSMNASTPEIVEVTASSESNEDSAAVAEHPEQSQVEEVKAEKKQRKPRDPNAPKQPIGAFFRYMRENRQNVKVSNPDASFGELTREIAATWRSMTDEEKKPYVEQYENEHKIYKVQLEAYKENLKKNGGVYHEEEHEDSSLEVDEIDILTAPSTPVQPPKKASKITPPTSPAPIETPAAAAETAQEEGQKKKKKHKTKKREGAPEVATTDESSKKKKKKVKHSTEATPVSA
jgi:hypothetical protein